MGLFKSTRKRLSVIDVFIKRGEVKAIKGLSIPKLAVAIFDPSGDTTHRTAAAHALGVHIPDNAIITRAWYDVITTFATANDSGTIALHVQGANDMVSALAISDGTNIWDAGIHGTLLGAPILGADANHDTAIEVAALQAASMLKLTDERELTATVATQALTAGKLILYVEYVLSA